jgi:hypothetical protein
MAKRLFELGADQSVGLPGAGKGGVLAPPKLVQ